MEKLLNYLFPPRCLFCSSLGSIFCDNCMSECSLLPIQHCIICDRISENGATHETCIKNYSNKVPSRLLAVYSYEGKVRDCIKFSKYGARQFLSLRRLCAEAVSICQEMWGKLEGDVCMPVPSSPRKLAFRGFNQANMIAEEVSKKFRINLQKNILSRTRNTEEQYARSRVLRRENVGGSFGVVNVSAVRGKKVLVVDDICTTGATFLESARVLYGAGAADVQCFALSKREKFCYNNRA